MRLSWTTCCVLSLAALALSGCDRKTASDAGTAPPVATPPLPASEDITMRYACDRGVEVFVLRDGKLQAHMPDGTIARLSRIADSTPPVFTGAELYFRAGDEGASLSQADGTEEVACQPE